MYIIFYLSVAFGISVILAALYVNQRWPYIAYGLLLGAFGLLYSALYMFYLTYKLLDTYTYVQCMCIASLVTLAVALWVNGWLLAVLSLASACAMPATVLQQYFSPQLLALYFALVLAITALVCNVKQWKELIVLSFAGYLLYHPLLFSVVMLEPQKGYLGLHQVFFFMAVLFGLYTIIPCLLNIVVTRNSLIDALLIGLSGIYTFAIIRTVIKQQWKGFEHFRLIKLFVQDPTFQELVPYLFLLYATAYLGLFSLLLLINRRALVLLSTFLCLGVICLGAGFYLLDSRQLIEAVFQFGIHINKYITFWR